jgi:DNA-binding IclR family transcriptional regulator
MEEGEMGVACVASPAFCHGGRLAAALNIAGTIQQIPKSRVLCDV